MSALGLRPRPRGTPVRLTGVRARLAWSDVDADGLHALAAGEDARPGHLHASPVEKGRQPRDPATRAEPYGPMKTLEHTLHADGARLHVEECGAGEPLLLLHGMTGTCRDWRHFFDLEALARTFRVVMPDARGHGRSTDPGGTFSFARLARDVLAVLDALGIDETRAVGVSLGGKTLLHVATRAPHRIGAMVLVSATPRFPEPTRALFRAAAAVPRSPEEWTRMRAAHVQGDAQIERLWNLPATLGDDPTDMNFTAERLGAITARTLVITGDHDPFYPVELAVELYRGIPRASLWVVPDALHIPIALAHRESFVREALRFLS